jgi:signal transduction histidine kinase
MPVLGDEVRLKQVMYNILNNAIKFTKQGSISIDASMQLTDKERYVFQCTITDTGCGIAGHKTSALFKPFEQVIDECPSKQLHVV